MKCLVVTAHPLPDSLCKHLTGHVVSRLCALKHDTDVADLYADGFDPVLTARERGSYYGGPYDSSGVSGYVKQLQEAEGLVLLFPAWWFGFPAILKGWFDRVWGPGIGYDHASDLGPIRPRLGRLRKTVVITTLGVPWWVDRVIMRQPVKRILKHALLGACAGNATMKYLALYKAEKLDERTVARFKSRIDRALDEW